MSVEITLFVIRVISGIVLLAMLASLFYVIWRDYKATISELEASRRVYGYLIPLQEVDGNLVQVGEKHPLLPLTSLGRSPTNTIIIQDSFASSEHAALKLRNGQWWLEDRQSRNGTTLNDMPINQSVVMTEGDIIGIGSQHFRLELKD